MTRALLFTAFTLVACGAPSTPDSVAPGSDPLESVSGEELFTQGMQLFRGGDYVRAEQYLAAAIERGYPEERALPALLNACVRGDRLVAALSYAQPYLAQHPDQWPLRLLIASIEMGLGRHADARRDLDRVLDTAAPDEPPQAHYLLGVLLRDHLEDPEGATAHFRRYLALEPEGPHREEARAALSAEERGLPQRIEADEVPEPEGETPEPITEDQVES